MTDMREAARQLLLQAGILAYLKKRDDEDRDAAKMILETGDKITGSYSTDRGTIKLGYVVKKHGSVTAKVTDPEALLAWAYDHRPDMIKDGVDTSQLSDALDHYQSGTASSIDMDVLAEAAHAHLGYLIASGATRDSLHPQSVTAFLEAIKANENGEWIDREGVVHQPPGVQRTAAQDTIAVTTDKSNINGVVEHLLAGVGMPAIEPPPTED